jgi:hypothetical protein
MDEAALDAIARSGDLVGADLVRLHRVVVELLSTWYDLMGPAPDRGRGPAWRAAAGQRGTATQLAV